MKNLLSDGDIYFDGYASDKEISIELDIRKVVFRKSCFVVLGRKLGKLSLRDI